LQALLNAYESSDDAAHETEPGKHQPLIAEPKIINSEKHHREGQ
jgi:hypothetical protein